MLNILKWKRVGPVTAVADTAYTKLIDPNPIRGRSIITRLAITCGATAHTLSVMQVALKTFLTAIAAAGQAVINVDDATGFTANDFVAVMLPNGRYEAHKIASVATKAITLTANLGTALALNAPVCLFGAPSENEQITIPTSATTVYESEEGYFGANEMGEPMLLHVNNITAASKIDSVNCPIISV